MKKKIEPKPIQDIDLENIINGEKPEEVKKIEFKFGKYIGVANMKEPMKEIFGEYFQTQELCVLAGKSGVGKSILAYTIADGISKGADILGMKNEAGAMKVLLYDFELEHVQIQKRYGKYEANENFLRPDMFDILKDTDGKFDFSIVEKHIDETNAEVIIIDNISEISLKSTQDQDQTLKLVKEAKLLKMKKEVSILLLAHTPKLKGDAPLELYDIAGSSNLHNFIDNAIMIGKSKQDKDLRYLKQVKNRSSCERDEVMIMRVSTDHWLHCEFEEFGKEDEHLAIDMTKEAKKELELWGVAEILIADKSVSYTDFCHLYADKYGKSIENGKKVLSQLIRKDIIIKDLDNKYRINRNNNF